MTTRVGGVSQGRYQQLNLSLAVGDHADAVAENRRRVAEALGLTRPPAFVHQVHGVEVVRLRSSDRSPGCVADGCWSSEPATVCAVMMADCLPILFCDDQAQVVAAAHAGWRGLAGGIVEATVEALPVPADRLLAWLGPAIGPTAFEVGEEVRQRFVDHSSEAAAAFQAKPTPGKFDANLFQLAGQRLREAGVERVFGGGVCTYSQPQHFYSHRRDGVCGRMAALIWLTA